MRAADQNSAWGRLAVFALLFVPGCSHGPAARKSFNERDASLTLVGEPGLETSVWPQHRFHSQSSETEARAEVEAWTRRLSRIRTDIATLRSAGLCNRTDRALVVDQLCREEGAELPLLEGSLGILQKWVDTIGPIFVNTRMPSLDVQREVSEFEQLLRRTDARAILLIEAMGGAD